MSNSSILTIDISPFFREGNEDGRKKAMETISQACSAYGFFQIANHGVPFGLINQALELSKTFFEFPDEEKRKCPPNSDALLPAGYNRKPRHSPDKNEYVVVFSPGSSFNLYPPKPPGFREVYWKTCFLIESISNDCLGLPSNFLKELNHDRRWDFMVALRYFPQTE